MTDTAPTQPDTELAEHCCGHSLIWHQQHGCGYLGFNPDHRCACQLTFGTALAARDRRIAAEALSTFADTLGVNVGIPADEWWSGYRTAQREVIRKITDRAEAIREGK